MTRSEQYHIKDLRKQPGKTIAESLGIKVAPDAPGGQRVAPPTSITVRPQHHDGEYDGFVDVDGYNRGLRNE